MKIKKTIVLMAFLAIASMQATFAQEAGADRINKVIKAYLELKNALAKDHGDSAKAAARKLFYGIDKVPADSLSPDHKKAWTKYAEKLKYDADHIRSTDDIEHQREHFTTLSVNMYDMLKALNVNAEELYYQFCPMANDDKGGFWISEKSKVENPYFGNKMPTCGSTKATLKATTR